MKVAIMGRLQKIKDLEPFTEGYSVHSSFKKIFDELNVLIVPVVSDKNIKEIENFCDALIIPGSVNPVNPRYYSETPISDIAYNYDEYIIDRNLIDLFIKSQKSILGICRGFQALNVYFGGTLNQDIPNHKLFDQSTHKVKIMQNSFLYSVYNNNEIEVNSYHRQSIKDIAPNFKVSAVAEDGIIEGIEYDNIIGVQWHPELLNDIEFFRKFIKLKKV